MIKYSWLLILPLLTSCAAGSIVSGASAVSLVSHTSEGLTAEAEQRIVDRVIRETNFKKQEACR